MTIPIDRVGISGAAEISRRRRVSAPSVRRRVYTLGDALKGPW
jgi:hypothetical protein